MSEVTAPVPGSVHATRFERWRPDKDAFRCTLDQLERPEGPGVLPLVVGA